MLTAILTIAALAGFFGALLGYAAIRFRVEGDPVADRIDALLPQTQCGQCGFPGCRPYAEAVARDEAALDLCIPGGEAVILAIADLLGRDPGARDFGDKVPTVARIDEQTCIGCTLCLQACPVDAIVGAAKQLHGVIDADCTGCGLCLPPCPVDAVRLVPVERGIRQWRWPYPVELPRSAAPESLASPDTPTSSDTPASPNKPALLDTPASPGTPTSLDTPASSDAPTSPDVPVPLDPPDAPETPELEARKAA